MPKRLTDINLNKEKLKELAAGIRERFYSDTKSREKFTATVNSDLYQKLREHIRLVTGYKTYVGKSTLRNIMTLKHSGKFVYSTYIQLMEYISVPVIEWADESPKAQRVYWGVNQGLNAGIYIGSLSGEFIPWDILKSELESRVISRIPKLIPVGSKVKLMDFHGKKDWRVWAVNDNDEYIASVWIGSDPENGWVNDGLIRTGKSIEGRDGKTKWIVYQIFARCTDGSYKMIKTLV